MEGKFQVLIKKDLYQVFLLVCPAALFTCHTIIPFYFGIHPWFVCIKKGEISRWEIFFEKNKCKTSWGHLHLNFLSPFKGLESVLFFRKYFRKEKIIAQIEGNENSMAKKIIDFIENSKENYPYCHKYFFAGPNSNTYAQWVLNNFPDFKLKLPWDAFGKFYKSSN